MIRFFKKRPPLDTTLYTFADFVNFATKRFEGEALTYAHGTDNPYDEALFIVMEAMGLPPTAALEPLWGMRLSDDEAYAARAFIEARVRTRKPAAYLLKKAWFQGEPFFVDERVIVPRSYIGELLFTPGALPCCDHPEKVQTVLDLCTGSGCLALLAAKRFPEARIDAFDLSADALDVAKINVATLPMGDRVHLAQGDLFAPAAGKRYDLILTNPPYVDRKGMNTLPDEHRHEPAMALGAEAGTDGLAIVYRIMAEARAHLAEDGVMILELGRCGPAFTKAYPHLPVHWLNTKTSKGEVFWIAARDLG
jgi:ribosomal protein L3 glutamine methyltransferase